MSDDDALVRAKRALEVSQPRRSELGAPLPGQSEINRLLAQAREAAEDQPRPPVIARPRTAIAREATGNRPGTLFHARQPPRQPALTGKVVVAIDATSSRLIEWNKTKARQDGVFKLVPQQYEIALAVYHNDVDTFTPFTSDRRKLRTLAAGIDCNGGIECLHEVLARVVKIKDVAAVVNITDTSAYCDTVAREYAETLRARGTQVFCLLDWPNNDCIAQDIFVEIAARTGGAVLPFTLWSLPKLRRHLDRLLLAKGGS
jgi:hypothetical protein